MPRFRHRNSIIPALLVAGPIAVSAATGLAADEEIILRVDGKAGTPFAGTCELNAEASGKTLMIIDSKVPFEAAFEGSSLSCKISAHARIEVEVVKGGSSSRSSTSGGQVNVNVGS